MADVFALRAAPVGQPHRVALDAQQLARINLTASGKGLGEIRARQRTHDV
jgi:hypothetical protein